MLVRGVVETEKRRVFSNGKVLREVEILEQLVNGKHEKIWVQVWGENGLDTSEGAKVDLEVVLRTDRFQRKDGSYGQRTKLVAVS